MFLATGAGGIYLRQAPGCGAVHFANGSRQQFVNQLVERVTTFRGAVVRLPSEIARRDRPGYRGSEDSEGASHSDGIDVPHVPMMRVKVQVMNHLRLVRTIGSERPVQDLFVGRPRRIQVREGEICEAGLDDQRPRRGESEVVRDAEVLVDVGIEPSVAKMSSNRIHDVHIR